MANQLQYQKSPYLLQHSSNPVNWRPWCKEAFEDAREQDKPVFLSIGYSTCHWCHVMAHESFEDEKVAEVINRDYIPIKVDREERPDIDAVYMAACIAITDSGGWPLTVLITPDQKPFWAGTYLPKKSLLSLLEQASKMWNNARERLLSTSDELTAHLRKEEKFRPRAPQKELITDAVSQYAQLFDKRWGGFGDAPKFPTPHNLIFLMRYARLTNDENTLKMVNKTLEGMYRGGIFDHVGGGFSRYSTDKYWLIPHFEKMLYDNALLAFAYAEAFQNTQRPLYESVARRTLDYALRELESQDGGFYCGQDADSDGVEGKYYVFTPDELVQELGSEKHKAFATRYGISTNGNFDGKNIPNIIGQQNIGWDSVEMSAIRDQLLHYRQKRTSLHKDDKILTSWNGLMIAALAKSGLVFNEPRYLESAESTVDFISKNLTGNDGRLLASWRDGQSGHSGKLEDYAFYAWGLLELYASTFNVRYLEKAQQQAKFLLDYFFDWKNGGLYPYASDDEQLLTRTKEVYDGAMPSGNSVAALIFSRLARLTGKKLWIEASELQFSYLAGAIIPYPAGHSFALLAMLEELWPHAELICTSREIPQELIEFLRHEPKPELTVLVKTSENETNLTAIAPFTTEYVVLTNSTRYFLCKNGACMKPINSISELKTNINNYQYNAK